MQRGPIDTVPFEIALARTSTYAHRQADLVIDEIAHHFADGAEAFEQVKDQTDRRLRLLVGIKSDRARRMAHVTHRHCLAELAPLRFGPPAREHATLLNVKLGFRHRPLRDCEILPRNSRLTF